MSRRQILRPTVSAAPDPRSLRRVQRYRTQLQSDQQSLARWMTKLKRAFHTVEHLQHRIRRIERQIGRLEPR